MPKKKSTGARSRADSRVPHVVINGRKTIVESAQFGVSLSTEEWVPRQRAWLYGPEHLGVSYWLSIVVNEASGEDGAPFPSAHEIPVFRAAGNRHPSLTELPGLEVDDQGEWEAWFGNDAPPLTGNVLRFRRWIDPKTIDLEWTAKYRSRTQNRPFRFSGPVTFDGLRVKVKNRDHADPFVIHAFGKRFRRTMLRRLGKVIEYGAAMPKGRRRWQEVTYWPNLSSGIKA